MRPIEKLLERLERIRKTGKGTWVSSCPAHDDRTPSMTIKLMDDDTVLVHCFSGCSFEDIMDAAGLEPRDLFPPRPDDRGPSRFATPPNDILKAVAHEILVGALAMNDIANGKRLSIKEMERVYKVAENLHHAARIAGVIR